MILASTRTLPCWPLASCSTGGTTSKQPLSKTYTRIGMTRIYFKPPGGVSSPPFRYVTITIHKITSCSSYDAAPHKSIILKNIIFGDPSSRTSLIFVFVLKPPTLVYTCIQDLKTKTKNPLRYLRMGSLNAVEISYMNQKF